MRAEHRAGPPEPPELPRALRLTLLQRIGLPFLFAIPVLALFGVFGEHYADLRATGGGVDLAMHYPDRMHYRQPLTLQITMRNVTAATADSVTLEPDASFFAAFPMARFSPPLDASQRIVFHDVAPGTSRTITVEIAGDRYWRRRGRMLVDGPGGGLQVPLSIFVFP